jgi:putative DNA primase/helicase
MSDSSDNSFAFYRRWLILKFNRTFKPDEQDRSLPEKLIGELSGIVNWALLGLSSLYTNERFSEPESHTETLKYYELMNNNVAVYADEMIQQQPGDSVLYSDIYQSYVTFCAVGGYRAKSKLNFKTELMNIFPAARFYTGHGQYKFENIILKSNEPF